MKRNNIMDKSFMLITMYIIGLLVFVISIVVLSHMIVKSEISNEKIRMSSVIQNNTKYVYESAMDTILMLEPEINHKLENTLNELGTTIKENNRYDSDWLRKLLPNYNIEGIYIINDDNEVIESTTGRKIDITNKYNGENPDRWRDILSSLKTENTTWISKFHKDNEEPYKFRKNGFKGLGTINGNYIILEVSYTINNIANENTLVRYMLEEATKSECNAISDIKLIESPPNKEYNFRDSIVLNDDGTSTIHLTFKNLEGTKSQYIMTIQFDGLDDLKDTHFQAMLVVSIFITVGFLILYIIFRYKVEITAQTILSLRQMENEMLHRRIKSIKDDLSDRPNKRNKPDDG